ncbi:hypothetical protein ACIP9H_33400 [Streptomyces sp. NPDC088732]|uniref:hypothetical protein n=1 Tax=Streptomyces sp. NPDC088732 TaxID=3365879 RepID=UPI0037F46E3F
MDPITAPGPYKYIDPQGQEVTAELRTGFTTYPFVDLTATDWTIGGPQISVWLPVDDAERLTAALTARTPFEHADPIGDRVEMEQPAEDWTVFTFHRRPRDRDEEPETVRVVMLTARLPQFAAAVTAAIADEV